VRSSLVVVAAVAAASSSTACGDTAVVLVVDGDLEVPQQLDAVCLSVADESVTGGAFGRVYALDALPQTLVVEPGQADGGVAVARGFRAGVEVARAVRAFEFGGGVAEVTLSLDACPAGDEAAPQVAGALAAPVGARAAVSYGRGGSRLVVAGGGAAFLAGVQGDRLVQTPGQLPAGADGLSVTEIVPVDIDGDCDDDLVVLLADQVPQVWRRDDVDFVQTDVALEGLPTAAAAVGVDVDRDGDMDLVAGGAVLRLYRNDGEGGFAVDPNGISVTAASDVTALAVADIDGDGAADLVVGQGGAEPMADVALLNDAAGSGAFAVAPAALPPVARRTAGFSVSDLDGDGIADLLVAVADGPLRVYINRGDGRLEDRSFVTLPDAEAVAQSVASRDWDGDCFADALAVVDGAVVGLGSNGGAALQSEGVPAIAAQRIIMADLDDDGAADGIAVGAEDGVQWLRR